MTASVTLDEERTAKLKELQAEIEEATGTKVTRQELLGRLIDDAYESRADLVGSYRDGSVPLTDEEIEEYLEFTSDSGDPIDEEDIDRILYDEEQL